MKLKAKELRKKTNESLMEMISEIDKQLMRFRASQNSENDGMIQLPTIGAQAKNVNWGLFGRLKRDKAILLTVLCERGIRR